MLVALLLVVSVSVQSSQAAEIVSVYWSGVDGLSRELRGDAYVHWGPERYHSMKRRKRDLTEGVMQILSDDFHIEIDLEPSHVLVGPWTKVEWLGGPEPPNWEHELSCQYSGKVRHYSNSMVALSGCRGVSGYIGLNKSNYVLQPFSTSEGEWFHKLDVSPFPFITLHNDQDLSEEENSPRARRSFVEEEEFLPIDAPLKIDDLYPDNLETVRKNEPSAAGKGQPSAAGEGQPSAAGEGQPSAAGEVQPSAMGEGHPSAAGESQPSAAGEGQRFEFSDVGSEEDALSGLEWQGHPVDKPWELVTSKHKSNTKTKVKKVYKDTPKWIETTLAVDSSVIKFHGRDEVLRYVLTLMNIVGAIYQEQTLQANIKFVLLKILFYVRRKDDQVKEGNPKKSLDNVNQWSYEEYKHETEEYKHDLAIWLTRLSIGGPAGYAPVAGICNPKRSATLNRDEGFTSAFILAHEIGHVLGLSHDGDQKKGNNCADDTGVGSVMAPIVSAAFGQYFWSTCSARQYQQAAKNWKCLEDLPTAPNATHIDTVDTLMANTFYTMDQQCRVEFGEGFQLCGVFNDIDPCSFLWCSHVDTPGFCKTKKGPPLEGTNCGKDKWCIRGTCQSIFSSTFPDLKNQIPQDGGWSPWSNFTSCSRTCGGGAKLRYRSCDSPRALYGGKDCEGSDEEFEMCNSQPCEKSADPREEECRRLSKPGLNVVPFQPEAGNPCRLFCEDRNTGVIVQTADYVIDGTSCSYDEPQSICVQGKCHTVGCDGVIDSNKTQNKCGICNHGNELCYDVIQRHTVIPTEVFTHVTILPRGARQIMIQEMSSTPNFLALKFTDRDEFLLRRATVRNSFIGLGTKFHYNVKNAVDKVTAAGPLLDELLLMVEATELGQSIAILTNYTVPKDTTLDPVNPDVFRFFRWKFIGWKTCSRRCGGGLRTRRTSCYDVIQQLYVPAFYCNKSPEIDMTPEPCNTFRCEYKWVLGQWEHCSHTCGPSGRQRREIYCVYDNYTASSESQLTLTEVRMIGDYLVDPFMCPRPAPQHTRPCNGEPCPARWISVGWSECSATCGGGFQTEKFICEANSNEAVDCKFPPPWNRITCNPNECDCVDTNKYCQLDSVKKNCFIAGFRNYCCKSCNGRGVFSKFPAPGKKG